MLDIIGCPVTVGATILTSGYGTVKKGNSVSYNRSFIADEDIRVGIVSIGYADGLLRSLGNRNVRIYLLPQQLNDRKDRKEDGILPKEARLEPSAQHPGRA